MKKVTRQNRPIMYLGTLILSVISRLVAVATEHEDAAIIHAGSFTTPFSRFVINPSICPAIMEVKISVCLWFRHTHPQRPPRLPADSVYLPGRVVTQYFIQAKLHCRATLCIQ